MTRALVACFSLALVLRVSVAFLSGPTTLRFGDAEDYLLAGRGAASGVYPSRGNLPMLRAPGLPFLVALTSGGRAERVFATKVALGVLDSLTVVLLGLLAGRVWRSAAAGLVTALAAAVYPPFVVACSDLRAEPLGSFFLASACLWWVEGNERRWRPGLGWAGVGLGMASLTRPDALLLLPFALVASAVGGQRDALRAMAALTGGFAVCLLPWVSYNAARYGELILVNDAGGYNLWRATHPETRAALDAPDPETFRRVVDHFETVTTPAVAAKLAGLSPGARSAAWRRLALENVGQDPIAVARFWLLNVLRFWRPWLDANQYGFGVAAGSGAVTGLLLLLALRGWLALRRERRVAALTIAGYVLVVWLSHVPFQIVSRFRVSFVDPLLIVLASSVARRPGRSGKAVPACALEGHFFVL